MRPPHVLVVVLALACAVPAFVGASMGTMTAEDAVGRAAVLVLVGWALDLLVRPAALRIIHGPPAAAAPPARTPEVPAHDGPTGPEVP